MNRLLTVAVMLVSLFLLVNCCGKQPQITDQARVEHDILTEVVTITNIQYDEDKNPIVHMYITNPHGYKLNVYEVKGQKMKEAEGQPSKHKPAYDMP